MSVENTETHFDLFDLPVAFVVDREQLDARYRELQRIMHPDRFASASDAERRVAMERAAGLNEAYRVLKDPLARARYLLELRGHVFNDEHSTTQDPGFLMEQMELREGLADVRGSADPFAMLGGLMTRIDARLMELSTELTELLADSSAEAQAAAVAAVQRMQFFRRLEQEAMELEADLEEGLHAS